MTPDDPRHGTGRGYAAGCREMCCRRANALYEKRRRLNTVQGISLAVPVIGAQRRIQALMAIGWTTTDIAHAAGWTHRNRVQQIIGGQKGKATTWLTRATHQNVADVYDELSMTIPEMIGVRRRSRERALRMGYLPPLAWDDIDDADEQPSGHLESHIDPVVVDRLIAGQDVASTRAEKVEAMSRWIASGRSELSLCNIHRWKPGRYVERKEGAA